MIVISLPEQLVHVYRNGVTIGVSTCSTGKPGNRTPTGVFTILQKNADHYSSTYNNAPMPNMQRLTWRGVALHAGNLPGYPASHGCVRLPKNFSKVLFSVTQLGTPVIIADQNAARKLGGAGRTWFSRKRLPTLRGRRRPRRQTAKSQRQKQRRTPLPRFWCRVRIAKPI